MTFKDCMTIFIQIRPYLQIVSRAASGAKALHLEWTQESNRHSKARSHHYMPATVHVRPVVLRIVRGADNSSVCMDQASTS